MLYLALVADDVGAPLAGDDLPRIAENRVM